MSAISRYFHCIRFQSVLVPFVLFLAGCAGQVNMHPPVQSSADVSPAEGLVVARVINLSAYPLPLNQLTVVPEGLNESEAVKPERLLAIDKAPDGSTVFASQLPPGRYALQSVRAFHHRGDFWYEFWIPAETSFGTFEVTAGGVSDLGSLLYYPQVEGEHYKKLLVRVPETATGEVVDKYLDFISYETEMLGSWVEDGFDQERYDQYLSLLQNPITFSRPYVTPTNSLIFLGRLGVLIERDEQGEWYMDAVDTNLELKAIAENRRGDRFVGGSEGRAFLKRSEGDWQDVSLAHDYYVDAAQFVNDRYLDILAHSDTQLSVYRIDLDSSDVQWNRMNSYSSVSGWNATSEPPQEKKNASTKPRKPRRMASAEFVETEEGLMVSVATLPSTGSRIFGARKEKSFIYDPVTWVTAESDSESGDHIVTAGAVNLGIKKPSFWSGKMSFHRHDPVSDTWMQINTHVLGCPGGAIPQGGMCTRQLEVQKKQFSFQSIPWYRNPQEAIALVTFSHFDFWTSKRTEESSIVETTDGGLSWVKTDKTLPFDYCNTLITEVTDRLLLSCDGATGDFYESLDYGESWSLVREQADF